MNKFLFAKVLVVSNNRLEGEDETVFCYRRARLGMRLPVENGM